MTVSFGQLVFDGAHFALTFASCRIRDGLVDIVARGPNCSLHFSRLPLGEILTADNLVGRAWEPSFDDLNALDTSNEADFIVFDDTELLPHAALLCCSGFEPTSNRITFDAKFAGRFRDDTADRQAHGSIVCIFDSPPCPKCNAPLRSATAKQCFSCGYIWR